MREWTLAELRRQVTSWLVPGGGGHRCRVCRRPVQLYKRKLHQGMAIALVEFYKWDRYHHREFMDYRRKLHRGASRDHGFLRYWSLVERNPEEKGFYRITERGRRAIENVGEEDERVPWAIWEYNKEFYGFVEDEQTGEVIMTTIREALGDAFDLDELLASLPGRGGMNGRP